MAEKKVRIYTIVVIGLLLLMAGFMLVNASKQSFWLDELDGTILYISGKLIDNNGPVPMFRALLEDGHNLPLYYIIVKPLYKMMPYGETYLLIPSIVFAIIGILIIGKAGKIIGGINIGFVTVCVAVSSGTLIYYGWEFRPYTITICFSSLTLLMYIKRLKQETNKNILNYSISLVLFLFCHWFASILALSYAFIDLYLYLRKKISLKCIFSYILAGLLFLPWVLLVLFLHKTDFSTFFGQNPSGIEPIRIVFFILSNSLIYLILFNIGFNLILFKNIRENENKTMSVSKIWFFIAIGIIWTILLVYIYCRYINPKGSLFVDRYFLVIMPHVFLITAYGFSKTFCVIQRLFFKTAIKRRFLYGIVILLVCFGIYSAYRKSYSSISSIYQPYREVAELLSKDKQVSSVNSLVICSYGFSWIDYYFSKRGFIIPANYAACDDYKNTNLFISDGQYIQSISLSNEDILRFDIIYLFPVHINFPNDLIALITQNYNIYQPNQAYQLYYCVKK